SLGSCQRIPQTRAATDPTSITRVLSSQRALMRRERARLQAKLTPVHHVIKRGAQPAAVLILERQEGERLKPALRRLVRRAEDFGHAMLRAGLRLKCHFDEIALPQRT